MLLRSKFWMLKNNRFQNLILWINKCPKASENTYKFCKIAPVQGPLHVLGNGREESCDTGVKVVNLDTEKTMKELVHRNADDLYLSAKCSKAANWELLEQ